ncbi:MAG: vanadium-dependent haloperoxidase [Actinomycetota bacterium]
MKQHRRLGVVLAALLLVMAVGPVASSTGPGQAAGTTDVPNAVTHWNLIAQDAIAPGRPPGSAEVLMGIVHAAMYDATVAIKGRYEAFAVRTSAPQGASADAATAAAAHTALLGLLPAQQVALDQHYTAYLATISDGEPKTSGIDVGQRVAAATLELRRGDGFNNDVPYEQPPPGPGVWEPTAPTPPADIKLKQVRPLALHSPEQFRPEGPDPIASRKYARDFDEVARLGRSDSTERSPEQTESAQFWAENTFVQWNRSIRELAADRGLGLLESARMMAMTHVVTADALIGCWEAKYHYNFWRPVHAVTRADTDGNGRTEMDATWTGLLSANHPEYPSGHACFTSAVVESLARYFGTDRVRIPVDSTVTGTTRLYDRLSVALKDVTGARIYSGLHFRNSMDDGAKLGRQVVADWILRDNFGRVRR